MQQKRLGLTALLTVIATLAVGDMGGLEARKGNLLFQQLVVAQTVEEREAEADRLINQGTEQFYNSQYQKALASYSQALQIYREIENHNGEANSLMNLGIVYNSLGQYPQARDNHEQSLVIFREISDRNGETASLGNLGNVYFYLGKYQEAIDYYEQSLAITRDIGDRNGETASLNNLGNVYGNLGKYQEAIDYYEQSLAITRDIGDRNGEAKSLNNLGNVYDNLGKYQEAIDYYEQSLAITRDIGDRNGEANSLGNLGNVYGNLGKYQEAIDYYEQSLVIFREIGDRSGEANSLGNLGSIYNSLEQYSQATDYHKQSLAITREIGDRNGEAASLTNLGSIYNSLGQYSQAIDYYEQSLAITREIGDRNGEAKSIGNLGVAYSRLGQTSQALEYYQQWLAMSRELGDKADEGLALNNIAALFAEQNQPELAIIFYKQSVNVRESIRKDLRSLDTDLQQSYTDTIAGSYRRLADLLLQSDRILEAQRVLDLLKVQELQEYLENVRGSEDSQEGIAQRAPENNITQGYNDILDSAIELGKELTQLNQIPEVDLTEDQKQRLNELEDARDEIANAFLMFLESPEVQAEIDKLRRDTDGQGFDLENEARSLQGTLQRLDNAVILYPLILDDRLELILVTPHSPPIRRTVSVSRTDLNKAILDYRTLIVQSNPLKKTQTKKAAQTLYNYLIKPLEADLAAADTQTIIYAPDGQLRYIPLAALHDGSQWLVQRYQVNNITALSLTDFTRPSNPQLSILAGAFTDGEATIALGQRQFSFDALPFAKKEVETLVDTIPSTSTRLDSSFTPDIRRDFKHHSIVHLATHAKFVDGRPEESFILFNDGQKQTLRDVQLWHLHNVDLVVLSACQTALGDTLGDGKEILGLGYQMQRVGAKATLASLWSVSDGGTQVLMNAFYTALANNPNMTKAEALRQAQIALITGDYSALGGERGTIVAEFAENELPSNVTENLSDPYYWSPFILIGNGL